MVGIGFKSTLRIPKILKQVEVGSPDPRFIGAETRLQNVKWAWIARKKRSPIEAANVKYK